MLSVILCFVFFFKQKTAYEMRISDWSSDVCSSDLVLLWALGRPAYAAFSGLEADHRAAIEREGRVAAKAQLLGRRPAATVAVAVAVAADAAPIDQFLAQSAGEIGLTLDRNEARGADQATIAIATAKDRKSTRLNSSH